MKSDKGLRPGMSKLNAAHARSLALCVREGISVEALVGYYKLIAMGHAARLAEDADGVYATCKCCSEERSGCILPTQAEISDAVKELMNRGHGLPVQAILLEANLHTHQSQHALDLGTIPASTMLEMRRLLLGTPPAPLAPSSDLPVIDAEVVEDLPAETTTTTQEPLPSASTDHTDNPE